MRAAAGAREVDRELAWVWELTLEVATRTQVLVAAQEEEPPSVAQPASAEGAACVSPHLPYLRRHQGSPHRRRHSSPSCRTELLPGSLHGFRA